MNSNIELVNRGMECLINNLGLIETEQFISFINSEHMDYTKWRSCLFEGRTLEEIADAAAAYEKEHPFPNNQVEIL
jgi:hypothetical protein